MVGCNFAQDVLQLRIMSKTPKPTTPQTKMSVFVTPGLRMKIDVAAAKAGMSGTKFVADLIAKNLK